MHLAVREVDEYGLGAYFPLSATARCYRAAALALANGEVTERIEELWNDLLRRHTSPSTEEVSDKLAPNTAEASGESTEEERKQRAISKAEVLQSRENICEQANEDMVCMTFLRLKLGDGSEMPGTVLLSTWKYGGPNRDEVLREYRP
ncbi:hypothetical protein M501DRAFT_993039 [Patellaria atrata CBS 101060]|uniref:Uncharacterized protein n=1 Tax=Patellaria atrata CBS 101060 TaxID=1346257 RepID=A0A9P4SAB8_9PEZI|nr:hypothetical protein M501DRAFT_993039 [Patellaria atrata CBS 101060]